LPEPDPENRAAISIRSARPPVITVTGGWGAPTPTLKIVAGPALASGHLTRKYPIDAAKRHRVVLAGQAVDQALERVLAERNERQKAADLLAPIYRWFTEGYDTPDLKKAKSLVDDLT